MTVLPDDLLPPTDAAELYRMTLLNYSASVLRGIRDHLEIKTSVRSPQQLVKAIEEHLRDPARRAAALADLPGEYRQVLALLPYVPVSGWRIEEIRELLRHAGCAIPEKAIRAMLGLGLLALYAPAWRVETLRHFDSALNGWEGEQPTVVAHPSIAQHFTGTPFERLKRGLIRKVRNVREADGLELLLRVAVLWERIAQTPLRLTHEKALFKRDRERLGADPVLTGPMFDELAPLGDIVHLAVLLGRRLHLLVTDPDGELLRATMNSVWQGALPLLQKRICQALLSARVWRDSNGDLAANEPTHLPARRWAVMLRLVSLEPGTWLKLVDLDAEVRGREPDHRTDLDSRRARPFRVLVGGESQARREPEPAATVSEWLEEFLLGAMYQVGAVLVAEDAETGAGAVQLSPQGRWFLGISEAPEPTPVFEKTLFAQPNHEVVVYRQGLSPELIGQFASFCRWKGLGAALTLELTPESVHRGLELGRTAEEMVGILERHSQRPVPPAVADSIRTWSGRRERLRLYSQCTVLEFNSASDLEDALARGVSGDRLSDQLLLIAGPGKVPFAQFRLVGSRDYRQPPSVCLEVEDDGITWRIDSARADLMVERELVRFAEPVPQGRDGTRRFRITPASVARAERQGVRATYVREWFRQHSGRDLPASVELMLHASSRSRVSLTRLIVLQSAAPEMVNGIMQHPATRDCVLRRVGEDALIVLPEKLDQLRLALEELGVDSSCDVITNERSVLLPKEPADGSPIMDGPDRLGEQRSDR